MNILTILLSIFVSATIDSTTIMIGDQTDLHLQATLDREARVLLPVYGETLIPGIEIVDRTLVDSTRTEDGRLMIHQYLTLTAFRDSLFYIAPLPFTIDGDTIYSEPLTLNVIQPFEIDSALAVTDIKNIRRAPIWWWGIIRWVLLGLLMAGLITAGVFLARYLKKQNNHLPTEVPAEPERPAEEIALEKLAIIREEKIWQQGKTKEYHSELTDVIREYIGRRYDIHSTEKTSDETLRAIRPLMSEQKEVYLKLEKMLRLADLVKFAKWTTTPDENETSLRTAYEFVNANVNANERPEGYENANENVN